MVNKSIGIRSLEFRVLGPHAAAFDAARQLHALISLMQALPLEVSCAAPAGFVGPSWVLKAPPFSHPAAQVATWLNALRQAHPQVVIITTSASDDIHTCEVWFPKAHPIPPCSSADRVCSTSEGMLTVDLNIQVISLFVEPVGAHTLDEWFVRFAAEPLITNRWSGLQAWLRAHAMENLLENLLPSPSAGDMSDRTRL